ncbi:MAG: chromosomal replication initiator protein DnaA [bacterium]|nr:chromosomal replication initiator protein DnaA [bacterium]
MELNDFWQTALADIELQISRPNFMTWLKSSQLIDKKDGVALISLPNNFAKNWVQNKYHKIILGTLRNMDDTTKNVEYIVQSIAAVEALKNKIIKKSATDNVGQQSFPEMKVDPETNLNPRYTINSFVVGKSNELAYAAATSVVKDVGSKYNPLFIYGGVGVGKTHLIQGVGNEVRNASHNKLRVKYVSSEKFTNEVIWGIKNKRMETIKDKYRMIDVLIVDDIQFIGGKERTEEEFFHTFNALYEDNKQIIISSDKPPRFIPTLHERLRSRFEGGMVVDIGYPDYELKAAILKNKLDEKGVSLKDEVVGLIAHRVSKNLRIMDGVLNRILFYQHAKNMDITHKIAEQIIDEVVQEPVRNIDPNEVVKAVAEAFNVSPSDLISRCRKQELVLARQVAMYLLRDLLAMSYPFIGEKLGKRDHTTAMYAYEKISGDINRNTALMQKIMSIKDTVSKS